MGNLIPPDPVSYTHLDVYKRQQTGNLGDVKPVGSRVFEMREHFGPGWRMYYVQRGNVLIVMLGGGDKSTQEADIANAINLAAKIEEE